MSEFNQNLWAPWRLEYIRSLGEESAEGCFLCRYAAAPGGDGEPGADGEHFVRRTTACIVVLNRFPYTNGHLLIAPLAHKARLEELTEAESLDGLRLMSEAMAALRRCVNAQGFNVGMNIGHCAGAGLPDHLHWHVVPRWSGDTNYMSVLGDARVIPQSLRVNYDALRAAWDAPRDAAAGSAL